MSGRLTAAAVCAVALLLPAPIVWACTTAPATAPASQGRIEIVAGDLRLLATPRPAPMISGHALELDVDLCAGPVRALRSVLVRVDAEMPEHRHGMNYRPSVSRLAPGRFRVEGVLLHMPGKWRFRFDVVDGERRIELAQTITVP